MAYRPFFEVEAEDTPATFANPATFRPEALQSVADVATVAGGHRNTGAVEVEPPQLTPEDLQALFDERAAILEYDCGLRRDEAERLACIQISITTIHCDQHDNRNFS